MARTTKITCPEYNHGCFLPGCDGMLLVEDKPIMDENGRLYRERICTRHSPPLVLDDIPEAEVQADLRRQREQAAAQAEQKTLQQTVNDIQKMVGANNHANKGGRPKHKKDAITQREVAEAFSVRVGTVARWESSPKQAPAFYSAKLRKEGNWDVIHKIADEYRRKHPKRCDCAHSKRTVHGLSEDAQDNLNYRHTHTGAGQANQGEDTDD